MKIELPEDIKVQLSFKHLLIPELLNVKNPSWEEADLRLLVYINSPWEAKAYSETLNALYDIAKKSKYNIYFDFCYKLSNTDYNILSSIPKYFGFCSQRTPNDFDMIWTSVSYLGDLPYLINFMFQGCFLSPYHKDRLNGKSPLILLGGCIASACDLVSEYIDILSLGEGEDRMTDILNYYIENNLVSLPLLEQIKSLMDTFDNIGYPMGWNYSKDEEPEVIYDWVHKPKFYRSFNLKDSLYTYKILCDDDISVNRTNILIGKGCTSTIGCCSFCVEGQEHAIWREYSVEDITKGMLEIKRTKPVETLILYAFNTNTHSRYPTLFNVGSKYFKSCITTGFRGDICSMDDNLVKLLKASGNTRVGIGVEGISDRIRNDILGKRFLTSQVLKIAKDCIESGIVHLKFNMMFTGYEEDKDWDEFEKLLRDIEYHRVINRRENFRITCSFTTMVHYNTTPMGKFERKALNKEFQKKAYIKPFFDRLNLPKVHVKFNTGSENMLLQLIVDNGRLIREYIEPYFKDSVKTLTRKYYGEIVDDLISKL